MRWHDETWADGDDASKPSTSKNRQDKDTELSTVTTPSLTAVNMCLIGVILYTDYYWEAEDTDSQGRPAQGDPARGDPGSRIVVAQIQDETKGMFLYTEV